jgi:hypothetical protein
MKARKRERVRRSSLVDWPVYPRWNLTMQSAALANKMGLVADIDVDDAWGRPCWVAPLEY